MATVTLRVTPGTTTIPCRQPVFYSAQGSESSDGSALSYSWSLSTPVGSAVAFIEEYDDGERIAVYPDVPGYYILEVTATNVSGDSTSETIYLLSVSNTSYIRREKQDYPIIGNSVGDFWKYVDNRDVFPTIWNEYAKISGATYRYIADAYLSKSINTIPASKVVTDNILTPELNVDISSCSMVFAQSMFGNTARTESAAMTNVVYIPASEVGGDSFFTKKESTVDITVNKGNTVTIQQQVNWFSSAEVKLLSGREVGRKVNLVSDGIYYKLDPYLPNILGAGRTSATVKARLTHPAKYKDLLLTVDNTACLVTSVSYTTDSNGTLLARFVLAEPLFVGSRNNLDWRLCSTLKSPSMDFSTSGVEEGDTLRFEVTTTLSQNRATIKVPVVGAYKEYVSFELSDVELRDSNGVYQSASISDKTKYEIATDLGIQSSVKNADGTYEFFGSAKTAFDSADNTVKHTKYNTIYPADIFSEPSNRFNSIYVTASTIGNSTLRLGVLPKSINRNTNVPIHSYNPVVACDLISEFVYPKQTQTDTNGNSVIVFEDGTVISRSSPEKLYYENIAFFVYNYGSFLGKDLGKASNSYIVTSNSSRFLTRRVKSGDLLFLRGIKYTIHSVISETQLRLVEDSKSKTLSNIYLVDEYFQIKRPNLHENYVRFSGLFSYSNEIPLKLYAPAITVDKGEDIENNFGRLVDYTIRDYVDYSSQGVAYLSAVKGLMYALVNGPTLRSALVASCFICNVPVTEFDCRVVSLNKNTGKVVTLRLDRFGESTGIYDTFSLLSSYTTTPFTQVATNPETLDEIKEGDILPAFSPISGRIEVGDIYSDPQLYHGLPFEDRPHKFQVCVDSNIISTRDLDALRKFFANAKPAHSDILITVYVILQDLVNTDVDLDIHGKLRLRDTGLSAEAQMSLDSRNGSGQMLRLLDFGEISTRTLLLGKDLEVESSTRITSSRGGFLLNTVAQAPAYLSDDLKSLSHTPPFTGGLYVRGKSLVKPGDYVFVYDTENQGAYEVTAVVSDTELDVIPTTVNGKVTKPLSTTDALAVFGIYRLVSDVIVDSATVSSVNSNTATFTNQAFIWDGVSVGDEIVNINDTTDRSVVREVVYDQDASDESTTLITEEALTQAESYIIYRESLLSKVYATDVSVTFNASDTRLVDHNIAKGYAIKPGDAVEVLTGSAEGRESTVVYVGHNFFYIGDDILVEDCNIQLRKDFLPELEASDSRLEKLQGFDKVSSVLESTSAVSEVTAATATSNQTQTRQITSSGVCSTGDLVYLYDGPNLVFKGRVWDVNTGTGTSTCFVLFEDAALSTGVLYSLTVEKSA